MLFLHFSVHNVQILSVFPGEFPIPANAQFGKNHITAVPSPTAEGLKQFYKGVRRMTWSDLLLGDLPLQTNLDFCLRLLLACICGTAIGVERSRHFKEAGVRTHVIVCVGAALVMVVSKYGFVDLALPNGGSFPGTRGADPARVAAQVVSGISFLGAGVIFKREGLIRGLTTAAGIWVTAAIGLAVGAGMLMIGLFAAVIVCVLQYMTHFFLWADSYVTNRLHFTVKNGYEFNNSLTKQLEEWNGTVLESSFSRDQDNGTTDYDLTVRSKKEITYTQIKEFIAAHEEIITCTNNIPKT